LNKGSAFNSLEEEVKALRSSTIGKFALTAIKKVSATRDLVDSTRKKFKQVLIYFGEDKRKMQPHELFNTVTTFCRNFENSNEEIMRIEKAKLRAKKREEKGEPRKVVLRKQTKLPPQVKETLSQNSNGNKAWKPVVNELKKSFPKACTGDPENHLRDSVPIMTHREVLEADLDALIETGSTLTEKYSNNSSEISLRDLIDHQQQSTEKHQPPALKDSSKDVNIWKDPNASEQTQNNSYSKKDLTLSEKENFGSSGLDEHRRIHDYTPTNIEEETAEPSNIDESRNNECYGVNDAYHVSSPYDIQTNSTEIENPDDILNELNLQLDSMNIDTPSLDGTNSVFECTDDILNELSQSLEDSGVNEDILSSNFQETVVSPKIDLQKRQTDDWYKPSVNRNTASPVGSYISDHITTQDLPSNNSKEATFPPPGKSTSSLRRHSRRDRALNKMRQQRVVAKAPSSQPVEMESSSNRSAHPAPTKSFQQNSTSTSDSRPYVPAGRSRREALRRMRG